jgi:hypothetical protein
VCRPLRGSWHGGVFGHSFGISGPTAPFPYTQYDTSGSCGLSPASQTSVAQRYKHREHDTWVGSRLSITLYDTTLTIIMECSTQSSTSNDEYVSSEGAGTTHLNSKSDQVMLRKHLHVRRQRAANACTQCHLRKVRCDVSRFGLPCTNCRADSKVCTIKESRRGVRNRKVER